MSKISATEVQFDPVPVSDPNAQQTVESFIERAVSMHSSDIFLFSNERSISIAVRYLGMVMPLGELALEEGRKCMTHIKAMAGMNISERRRPLDGRWIHQSPNGATFDLRINTLPTLHGEDFSIRILDRDFELRPIDSVGLLPNQLDELRAMLNSPSGLVLVTGPTGAGKSTTLYACLNYLNDGKRKINTIEDPIEYAIGGLRQSQINPSLGVDFPDLLRNVLRQSPDVIMIGEIRDSMTARTAIRAANSGHLVLATLHAPVAAAAIQSMLSLDVNSRFLASSLRGVITQRLVRVLCPKCKSKIDVPDGIDTFHDVRKWLRPGEGTQLYGPRGCEQCHNNGYSSRIGVFEVLPMTSAIRNLVVHGGSTGEIEQKAIQEGMVEFRRAGLISVARGTTTIEEILRVIPAEFLGLDS